ncbi:GNAT family N-acetyltransferase [Vibrio sinaloensis]|nr:GNAT family protein [Vibrio sinaloensis]
MFRLETARLVIRDMTLEDEDAFVAISQNSKYQRFYDEQDCHPEKYRELTRLFIEQAKEHPRTSFQLAIEHKEDQCFIGTVCLRLEGEQQASIGCGMSRAYQADGLILEAASALVEYGFNHLEIHRIYAETISRNRPAIKLCRSLGMVQEAHLRHNRYFKNQWWDTVVLAVLADDWLARKM